MYKRQTKHSEKRKVPYTPLKMFDLVAELTSGGPGSATELASINLKREAFEKWKTGYSSAFAVILFVTIFGFGNVYVKVMNKIKDR